MLFATVRLNFASAGALAGVALTAGLLRGDPPLVPMPDKTAAAAFTEDLKPFFTKYCVECHQGEKAKGGLAIERYATAAEFTNDREAAEKIVEHLESGLMPPEKSPQPAVPERARIVAWIRMHALKIDCGAGIDPGRVTIRRLNRTEYNNTVRDLLGIQFRPADDFPSDDIGYGFDNIGDVLSLPPVLLERYLAAAEKITDEAILTADEDRAPIKSVAMRISNSRRRVNTCCGHVSRPIRRGPNGRRCRCASTTANWPRSK
jgi:cytochrome c551/c552